MTLRIGASGHAVSVVQQRLNARGAHLDVDARFGQATRAAVEAFQSSHRLKADGVVGRRTARALGLVDGFDAAPRAASAAASRGSNQGAPVREYTPAPLMTEAEERELTPLEAETERVRRATQRVSSALAQHGVAHPADVDTLRAMINRNQTAPLVSNDGLAEQNLQVQLAHGREVLTRAQR